jgi:acyl carrier protein
MPSASDNPVFDKVALAVGQTLSAEDLALTPATRIFNDLGIGRFGRLKLALYLEETFDVELPDEAVARFETVGDIMQYVSRWSHEIANASAHPIAANHSRAVPEFRPRRG